jgi:hypothetical protein
LRALDPASRIFVGRSAEHRIPRITVKPSVLKDPLIFISHSTRDKLVADKVCAGLEASGLRCWIAPRDIMAGTDWGGAIVDAISKADVMVLIFSGHANESPQIRREVERAVAKNVRVVPFRIEDVPPAKSLEYFVSTSHWMDAFAGSLEGHIRQLGETIRLLGATRDSSQVPPPIRKHTGARLGDGESAPAPAPPGPWMRPAGGILAAAAVLAASYFFLLRRTPPEIEAVNFPPVIVAGSRDAVGTVQFSAGQDDVAEAEFAVVSAEKFEPFSVRPSVAGEKQGSISFGIRSRVPQQVTLRATLVDARGRRSRPVSFSFEVRKASAAENRSIEIQMPQGFKLKLPH